MTRLWSRRHMLAAAVSAPALSFASRAQRPGTLVIENRNFIGTRSLDVTGGAGGEGLRVRSNTLVRRCQFLHLGNGGVRVNVPTVNLTIEECDAYNMYRFFEDTSSAAANPAILSNFVLRRVVGRELDHGLSRIRYYSSIGLIEDVAAHGSRQCDAYCVGFQLSDQAHHITYRRAEAHGFQETGTGSGAYWNGDGFSDERGNWAIRYLSCLATNCTDGGFDLKSAGMYLEGCIARGNKRNFRLWSSGTLQGCRSEEPVSRGGIGRPAHFSFHGAVGRRFVLVNPQVRASPGNDAPVFLIETSVPLVLEIVDADIHAPGAPLFAVDGPEPHIVWSSSRARQRIRVARER